MGDVKARLKNDFLHAVIKVADLAALFAARSRETSALGVSIAVFTNVTLNYCDKGISLSAAIYLCWHVLRSRWKSGLPITLRPLLGLRATDVRGADLLVLGG